MSKKPEKKPEGKIEIKSVNQQERCDVCHQADMFDPATGFCARCQHIALQTSIPEEKINNAPLPEFLSRRLSSNVSIRCYSCGEFIMSRSSTCRHCGNYVRFEESAQAAEDERMLSTAFERVHNCTAASSLCWDFLKWHLWGFPLTLLLTPLSAIVSLVLMLRTWLMTVRCYWRLLPFQGSEDSRILEARRSMLGAASKSAAAWALATTIAMLVVYSGAIALPMFWDNYAKGRRAFDRGEYVQSEELFHKALINNPKNIDARLYYARAIWHQYVDDRNANSSNNKDVAERAIDQLRLALEDSNDLKVKDQIYTDLANIYKTLNDRSQFEHWMLARAKMSGQPAANQVDAYVQLGILFANDVTSLMNAHVIKDVYPRAYQPLKNWPEADVKMAGESAMKAQQYLSQALALNPTQEMALPLLNQLKNNMLILNLKPASSDQNSLEKH